MPNVGKSTLFNALTKSNGAQAANYPFCTIEPNVGIVEVPDPRLNAIAALVRPQKTIPAIVEFVDIAGLVKGASKGEGLGNAFLSHIREVDAICHVVRVFGGGDIIHVEGSVNPKRDRETIETELIIADLEKVQKRIEKIAGGARSGNSEQQKEHIVLETVKKALEQGLPANSVQLEEAQKLFLRQLLLITDKPMLYALNVSDEEIGTLALSEAKSRAGLNEGQMAILVSAKLEEELISLSPEDREEMLNNFGVQSSGLDSLIRASYHLLGLQTYFTAGEKEVRAWTMHRGDTAPKAAGVIHSDFEKGFIRAETIAYDDFIACGGEAAAKASGKLRVEGKDYVVQDGDVLHFRFTS